MASLHPLFKQQICDEVLFEIKKFSDTCACMSSSGGFMYFVDLELQKVTGKIRAHEEKVSNFQITQEEPKLIFTCSSDSSIKCFDQRIPTAPIAVFQSNGKKPLNSISVQNDLLVSGSDVLNTECSVDLWDLRTNSLMGSSSELHTEDITCVEFLSNPATPMFCTSSVDGLSNICRVENFMQEGPELVLNSGTSISKSKGTSSGRLNVFLSTEEYLIWDLSSGSKIFTLGSIKQYGLDCLIDVVEINNRLHLFCGSYSGEFSLAAIDKNTLIPMFSFSEGHDDSVRGVCVHDCNSGLIGSVGDDGKVCYWRTNQL